MDLSSFSHGQIKSKIWLAENLEKYLGKNIAILGSWYNLTAFILKTRGYKGTILGIDKDPSVKEIANLICSCWYIAGEIDNITGDATEIPLTHETIINCSSEHMSAEWYNNVSPGCLVCIQSSNIVDEKDPWFVVNPSTTIESFAEKYQMSQTLFLDTLRIQYSDWGYDRYMLIGYK